MNVQATAISLCCSLFDCQAVDPDRQRRGTPRIERQGHGTQSGRKITVALPSIVTLQRDLEQTPALTCFVIVSFTHQITTGLWLDVAAFVAFTMQHNKWPALPTRHVCVDRLQPET